MVSMKELRKHKWAFTGHHGSKMSFREKHKKKPKEITN